MNPLISSGGTVAIEGPEDEAANWGSLPLRNPDEQTDACGE
jgi:hypothetical protein